MERLNGCIKKKKKVAREEKYGIIETSLKSYNALIG